MNRSLHNNIRTIYLLGFFNSFMVVNPVFVPLLQGYGLSMSQVLQTQALFALTIALFEVPSGYIADMWGRRRAICNWFRSLRRWIPVPVVEPTASSIS